MEKVRTWTKIGESVVGSPIDEGTILGHDMVTKAIERLDWHEIPKAGNLEAPAMPGMGISKLIEELKIPRVSHVAWSSELAPYGFYGIKGHYSNGDADIYAIDSGTHLTTVCTDFVQRGCGNATHVIGTNGGTMPCGRFLRQPDGTSRRYYCAECETKGETA